MVRGLLCLFFFSLAHFEIRLVYSLFFGWCYIFPRLRLVLSWCLPSVRDGDPDLPTSVVFYTHDDNSIANFDAIP